MPGYYWAKLATDPDLDTAKTTKLVSKRRLICFWFSMSHSSFYSWGRRSDARPDAPGAPGARNGGVWMGDRVALARDGTGLGT